MKGGWAAAKAAAAALEGGHKILIIYEGVLEANPSNYVLLSIMRKVGEDKNGGDGGSVNAGGSGGRDLADQRNNMTRFMMHGNLTSRWAELAVKKAASNRRRVRGSGQFHPPKKARLDKLRLLGRMEGIKATNKDNDTMGGLAYHKRKRGSSNASKGLAFTLRAQT